MNYGTSPQEGPNGLRVSHSEDTPRLVIAQQAFSSRINVINEIAIDANHSLDEEEILQNAGRKARWLLDFDHASAYLLPNQPENVEGAVTILFAPEANAEFYEIYARKTIDRAIESRQPLLLPDPLHQGSVPVRSPYAFQLIIPLQSEGRVLGTLNFSSARYAYTHDDMRIGYLLALLLSGAIRNARRFTEVRDLYHSLEEAYAHLQETEKRRNSLTSMIVHDLRSPLMTILGTLELVQGMSGELNVDEMVSQMVRRAHRAGHRMAGQISDLIDVNKFDDGVLTPQCEPLDLGALLRRRAEEYEAQARDENKRFFLMIPETLPAVSGDAELIGRVFDNLVHNAYKYTEPGGTISICVAAGEQTLTVSVSDDGIGVSPKYREQIFDKYSQISDEQGRLLRKGSGLGLAFCRLAIEAHGGRIWVTSNRPKGTIFAFTLPHS